MTKRARHATRPREEVAEEKNPVQQRIMRFLAYAVISLLQTIERRTDDGAHVPT